MIRRLLRYTLDGLTLLSAVLCVAACALCARGKRPGEDVERLGSFVTPRGARLSVAADRAGVVLLRPPAAHRRCRRARRRQRRPIGTLSVATRPRASA